MSLLSFPREVGLKRAICNDQQQYRNYITKLNGKANIYTSLYSFRDKDRNAPWKFDTASAIIDRAWWDFDAGEQGGIEQVKQDVAKLLSRLDGDIRLVATGRGFHVHQLFSRPVIGIQFHRHLARYQKMKASGLATLDGFAFPAKLTRIPNTFNATRGRWAVSIPTHEFIADPLGFDIPKIPIGEYAAWCPFTGMDSDSTFDFVRWANDNPIQEVELPKFDGDISSAGEVPIMPCLEGAIRHENPKHEVRVALVQHMAQELRWFADPQSVPPEQRAEIEDTIFEYIKSLGWRDFKENLTRIGIKTNMNYDNAPSCRWFNLRGMCKGKCWRYDGSIS